MRRFSILIGACLLLAGILLALSRGPHLWTKAVQPEAHVHTAIVTDSALPATLAQPHPVPTASQPAGELFALVTPTDPAEYAHAVHTAEWRAASNPSVSRHQLIRFERRDFQLNHTYHIPLFDGRSLTAIFDFERPATGISKNRIWRG
jgi:hypothetical protein